MKAVLFDFDLTLVNSLKAVTAGLNELAARFNLAHKTEKDVMAAMSLPTREFWTAIWGSYDPAWHDYFKDVVSNLKSVIPEPMPGAVELLQELRDRGLRIGLATNRTTPWQSLEVTGLAKYFDTAVGALDVSRAKPAPDMLLLAMKQLDVTGEQCLYVGDALCDMEAAFQARMRGVGLLSGGNSEEALFHAGAWQVRREFKDLRDIF